MRGGRTFTQLSRSILAVAALGALTACADSSLAGEPPPATSATTGNPRPASTSTTTSTSSSTTSTSTTSTSSTTSSTSTTTVPPAPSLGNLGATLDLLAVANPAVSATVRRDGNVVLARASGVTADGTPATPDSPMAVASVGKLLTAALIARLDAAGRLDVDAPTPWAQLGLTTDPAWGDVTPRELLQHTSGMPVVRSEWFERSGDCRTFLPTILAAPPAAHRGRWTYSNGNYCALGLLAETLTGLPLDQAVDTILLGPLGADGVHLSTAGQLPSDVAYPLGLDRLNRLGGAGSYLASTDDIAAVLDSFTPADRAVIAWPGIMNDQYGWGHTGSVDGVAACAWVLEGGRTVVTVTVSGTKPSSGGRLCDAVVPALASDLGLGSGTPVRTPP